MNQADDIAADSAKSALNWSPSQTAVLSILFAVLQGFETIKSIVRILLRGEAWRDGDFPAFYATALASYRLGLTPYVTDTVQSGTGIHSAFATTYPPFSILFLRPIASWISRRHL